MVSGWPGSQGGEQILFGEFPLSITLPLCGVHYLELRQSRSSQADTQFAHVSSKLVSFGALYSKSERFFPVEYLALALEQRACEMGWATNSVHRLLTDMGVATTTLFTIYDKMFKQKVGGRESQCLMLCDWLE